MIKSELEIIHELEAITKGIYLIAIDGRSGAGKSTLAKRLHENLTNVVVVHTDDFYREMDEIVRRKLNAEQGYYQYFDWERLEQQVFAPLSNHQTAHYQRYDWIKGKLAETIQVNPQGIIIIEGIYSIRHELRDYYDLRIWIETSEKERYRRQIARGENTIEWIQRWASAEIFYIEHFDPKNTAHVIIAGE